MRLTDYLREHKLTHAGFAAKIGATQAAVTRYVNGRRKPSLAKLILIERVTDGAVRVADFASATGLEEGAGTSDPASTPDTEIPADTPCKDFVGLTSGDETEAA